MMTINSALTVAEKLKRPLIKPMGTAGGLSNGSRLRGRKVTAGISAAKQRLCVKMKSKNSHAAAFYK